MTGVLPILLSPPPPFSLSSVLLSPFSPLSPCLHGTSPSRCSSAVTPHSFNQPLHPFRRSLPILFSCSLFPSSSSSYSPGPLNCLSPQQNHAISVFTHSPVYFSPPSQMCEIIIIWTVKIRELHFIQYFLKPVPCFIRNLAVPNRLRVSVRSNFNSHILYK